MARAFTRIKAHNSFEFERYLDILTHYTLYMNFEQSKFTHIWIFRKPFDFPLVCLPKEDEEKNED